MLINPIVALLHNQKLKHWHPIIFAESPLPGPPDAAKPVRHKSKGHHTVGFATREEALVHVEELLRVPEMVGARACVETDMAWDGEDIPAAVAFFVEVDGKPVRAL